MWAHGMLSIICAGCIWAFTDAKHEDLEKRQHYIAERQKSGHRESGSVGERLKET